MPPATLTQSEIAAGFTPVDSSNVKALKWVMVSADPEGQQSLVALGNLSVLFHNGTHYEYAGVPKVAKDALMAEPRPGKLFNQLILQAKPAFPFRRLPPHSTPDITEPAV